MEKKKQKRAARKPKRADRPDYYEKTIADHAMTNSFLCSLYRSLCTGGTLPREVPVLYDLTMTDILSGICEEINKIRRTDEKTDNRN